jgi:cell division protein FtsN
MVSKRKTGMKQQHGGTVLGLIIGVVIGLAVALAVAVYVTKVPVPFMSKGTQSRSPEQNEAESRKNKDWDPNAALYGKNPANKVVPAADPVPSSDAKPEAQPDSKASAKVDPKATTKPAAKAEIKPAVSADPLGDLAKAKAGASGAEPFSYFVQVGAFRTAEDAETHRAKLSLSGIETKISEREQSGRTVYRVRVGPFDKKDEAEASKLRLDQSGLETALVRVQR